MIRIQPRPKILLCIASLLFALLLTAGCNQGASNATTEVTLRDVFPDAEAVPGWEPEGDIEVYDTDTLYELVNGQADAFFVYGFENVAVRSYQNTDGVVLRVEIWQLATPADAYGLFTTNISGEPTTVGHTDAGQPNGDTDPGRRVGFWQSRYYTHIGAREEISNEDILTFATVVADALPKGGTVPSPVQRLPNEGLVERSAIFFHEELSIQNDIWLGGENILGLTQKTNGVLGRYDVDGARAYVILVEYPNSDAATAAVEALHSAEIAESVVAEAQDALLGAVFGEMDVNTAREMLAGVW